MTVVYQKKEKVEVTDPTNSMNDSISLVLFVVHMTWKTLTSDGNLTVGDCPTPLPVSHTICSHFYQGRLR